MRQIGTIDQEGDARRLADYLLTLQIETRVDPSAKGGYVLWARREEQTDRARREFEEFLRNPADPRYQGVTQTARQIRKQKEREDRRHARNSISLDGRWDYRPAERCPLTLALIVASVVVFVASGFGHNEGVLRPLYLSSYTVEPAVNGPGIPLGARTPVLARSEGLAALYRGQVWRLVTPIFIHFGTWHLLFNMFWLYDLGGLIEMRKGTLRLLLIVLVAAVVSNLAQYLAMRYLELPPHLRSLAILRAGGMSGVVYALFGYVWMKSRHETIGGMYLRGNTKLILLIGLALGFTPILNGIIGPVGNAAHLAGLVVGLIFGLAPHWRAELRRWT